MLPEVPVYNDLLDPKRKNAQIVGFDFDVDKFENLIDAWTPQKDIPIILGVTHKQLDKFCTIVYGMTYDDAYIKLIGITDYWMRKAYKNLAIAGNATAINTVSKHFMGLEDKQEQSISVTIVNDLDDLRDTVLEGGK